MDWSDFGAIGQGLGGLSNSIFGGLNFWQQNENLKYQKKLQKQIFAREDNAVQRRVADLRAAGLSPVLAAGSAASAGPVISTTPPQFDIPSLPITEMAKIKLALTQATKQIEKTDAEIEIARLTQKNLDADRRLKDVTSLNRLADIRLKDASTSEKLYDLEYAKESKTSTRPDSTTNFLRSMGHILNHSLNNTIGNPVKKKLEDLRSTPPRFNTPLSRINLGPRRVDWARQNQTYFLNEKTRKWEKRRSI